MNSNELYYTQQLIEENIFERKKETIYKHSFTDNELKKYEDLFNEILSPQLNKIIEFQNKYSHGMKYAIQSDIMKTFIEKLFLINCPQILKGSLIDQQFFLLYLISILFYRFNETILKLNINDFINRIYYTNIITIYSRHFVQSKRLIFKIIKSIYNDIKINSGNTLTIYQELYHNNESIIKNDIMQLFLTNILPKFNPLNIENIEDFYSALFKRIFFFYLKSKTILIDNINSQPPILQNINILESQSERFKIYEEAIYLAQIQQICENSNNLNNINVEFEKLKEVILPNDIQKLFLYQNSRFKNTILNHKIDLFKIHTLEDSNIEKIKNKIPQVYRLLRSIHIFSPNTTFNNNNKQYMKEQFYLTLCDIFKNKFDISSIKTILQNISEQLVESLTTGEFIDVLTLTQIDINGQKFIDQFKEFLKLLLTDLLFKEDNNE